MSDVEKENVIGATDSSDSKEASLNVPPAQLIEKNATETVEQPSGGVPQQAWNSPRVNIGRTIAACVGLLIIGASDAACGALIPYLETYYGISYIIVSCIFIAPVIGYGVSAVTLNRIHMRFGQRGIAFGGPVIRMIGYMMMALHPPWVAIIFGFIIIGYGNGIQDGAWNAWIGHLLNANEVLGILHGAYGLGATLGPLVSTALITKANLPWWTFYYIMIGVTALELVGAGVAFWKADGKTFREQHPVEENKGKGGTTKEVTMNKVVWICAMFLFIYVGVEVSIGGWVVTFMIRVRGAEAFDAGMSATAFWLGLTVGRVVLGFVTGRIGEKLAILIYMGLTIGLHFIFYFVPSIPASFVSVTLEGFFLGPLFPAAIVAATKILPPHLHVSAIAFAAAIGAGGACLLPFAIGAIAQAKGVQVLMPIVLAFLVADAAVWSLLPGLKKDRKEGDVESGRKSVWRRMGLKK